MNKDTKHELMLLFENIFTLLEQCLIYENCLPVNKHTEKKIRLYAAILNELINEIIEKDGVIDEE